MRFEKRTIGLVVIVGLFLLGGCLTFNVDTSVNEDGTIEEYDTEIVMNESAFDTIAENQTDEEFATALRSGYDEDNYEEVRANVERLDGNVSIQITLVGFDPADIEAEADDNESDEESQGDVSTSPPDLEVTVEDDRIRFVDHEFEGGALNSGNGSEGGQQPEYEMAVNYELEMPGEIVESETNADEIDGNVARWERTGESVNMTVEAVSELPDDESNGSDGGDGGDGSDGSDGSDDGSSGGGLPGFGAGVAVVALLAGLGLLARRRD